MTSWNGWQINKIMCAEVTLACNPSVFFSISSYISFAPWVLMQGPVVKQRQFFSMCTPPIITGVLLQQCQPHPASQEFVTTVCAPLHSTSACYSNVHSTRHDFVTTMCIPPSMTWFCYNNVCPNWHHRNLLQCEPYPASVGYNNANIPTSHDFVKIMGVWHHRNLKNNGSNQIKSMLFFSFSF